MPNYNIEISETATKQLNKLPHNTYEELIRVIQSLPRIQGLTDIKNLKAEKAIEFVRETIA